MFSNQSTSLNWNNTGNPGCTGNCRGIIGSFQKYVQISPSHTPGGPNPGAMTIKLTE